jgi:hypothetical protein
VPLLVHYMIGLPGETAAEVNATLAFALDLYDEHGAWPAVQYATPLPGTALAAGRSLPVVDDWGPHFQRGGGRRWRPSIARRSSGSCARSRRAWRRRLARRR